MQALILAAGMGKRLKELTYNNTKCMIEVNGVTLIERALRQLEKLQLSKIVIVVGYESKKLIDHINALCIQTPVLYVNNPLYYKTNNIYSLSLAKEYLMKEDTLLMESDLIFEDSVLQVLLDDPRDTLALVDKYEAWMDGTCIKVGYGDSIVGFASGTKFLFEDAQNYYKTVNIYKFARHFSENYYVPFLEAYSKALGDNEYYEQVLRVITMLDDPKIKAKKLNGQLWYEIDDIQDLDIASSMFAADWEDKVINIQKRYGGYWRYPYLMDFCYLGNRYFPPQKLMNEMQSSFGILLTQYPSGMSVNSLLAAKNFGIRQEHILVGNGAAELIKCLLEKISGRVGLIYPIFEEYTNRCIIGERIIFTPENENFTYKADELMAYFADKGISTLILVNPDNPSGNYLPQKDVIRLIRWCAEHRIRIIVDESFIDFAEEADGTLIREKIITEYPNLVVIKSISKSFGVPGIRLGILVSGDHKMILALKKEVAIWNVNSFGEFFMQIIEKYKQDYWEGLAKFKAERIRYVADLGRIDKLRVIPSQGNYVMAEVLEMSAKELTKVLLGQYKLLIKDLSGKTGLEDRQYVRLAVRDEADNRKLVSALKEILGEVERKELSTIDFECGMAADGNNYEKRSFDNNLSASAHKSGSDAT